MISMEGCQNSRHANELFPVAHWLFAIRKSFLYTFLFVIWLRVSFGDVDLPPPSSVSKTIHNEKEKKKNVRERG